MYDRHPEEVWCSDTRWVAENNTMMSQPRYEIMNIIKYKHLKKV